MTKDDLKSGMVVVTRDGNKMLVLTNCYTKNWGKQQFCLIDSEGFMTSDDYDDDLLDKGGSVDYDIMKVYCSNVNISTYNMSELDSNTLLWERDKTTKPKELTVAEIEKELGYPIKIVK